jgi:hypothetical protein
MCIKRKRIRKGQFPLLDENLYNYLLCVRTNNGEVSTIDLQNKSMEIAKQLGYNDFQASNGYIEGFKTRFNVKFKILHGEAASVLSSTICDWFSRIMFIIANYDTFYIFNLDETGLFNRAGRGKSNVSGQETDVRGTKSNKERVTVSVGESMNGEKLPLLVIGKSKKPRCIKGVKELQVLYEDQENAWMNGAIFQKYLQKLDGKLGRDNKKGMVFLDNCRAHPT